MSADGIPERSSFGPLENYFGVRQAGSTFVQECLGGLLAEEGEDQRRFE